MTIITRITITPNARIIPPTNDAASNPLGSGQAEVVGIDDMVVMDSVGPEESVSCVVVKAETDDVVSGRLVTELMVSEEKFPEVVLSVGTIVWAVSVVPG